MRNPHDTTTVSFTTQLLGHLRQCVKSVMVSQVGDPPGSGTNNIYPINIHTLSYSPSHAFYLAINYLTINYLTIIFLISPQSTYHLPHCHISDLTFLTIIFLTITSCPMPCLVFSCCRWRRASCGGRCCRRGVGQRSCTSLCR